MFVQNVIGSNNQYLQLVAETIVFKTCYLLKYLIE
jgi:hypothetical protein